MLFAKSALSYLANLSSTSTDGPKRETCWIYKNAPEYPATWSGALFNNGSPPLFYNVYLKGYNSSDDLV